MYMSLEVPQAEKITRAELYRVTDIFLESPEIKDVEVYGSLSRQDRGNDIDLILITSKEKENLFYKLMSEELVKPKDHRDFATLAGRIFTNGREMFTSANHKVGGRINILVHASDWRNRSTEIMNNSYHSNGNFIKNIAGDAVSVQDL